jgi:hypothetical protein
MIYNDERPERIRGTIYLSAIVLFVGYQSINAFVPNADMILATRILATGFYSAVLYVYGRDAWGAFRKPEPKRSDFLIVGIWLSFLSHWCQNLYSLAYRLAQAPEWLLTAEVVSPIVMLSMVASVLHVAAPGAVDGTVPRRNRIALGIGIGLAVFAVAVLMATRPDIRPIIDRARPYIGDWFSTGYLVVPGAPPA